MKHKGKIKAIPVLEEDIVLGTQVLYKNDITVYILNEECVHAQTEEDKINSRPNCRTYSLAFLYDKKINKDNVLSASLKDLKKLVISYDLIEGDDNKNHLPDKVKRINLPLKWNQWEEVIKKDLVDSDTEIEFQIRYTNGKKHTIELSYKHYENDYEIAIVSLKEKIYTEEEVIALCKDAYLTGWDTGVGIKIVTSEAWLKENIK